MAWTDLEYETQLKVIDKIRLASEEETDLRTSNGLMLAARELDTWSNNYLYGTSEQESLEEFMLGIDREKYKAVAKAENKARTYAIVGILAPVGTIFGGQLTDGSKVATLIGALIGCVLFATLGVFIAKK